MSTAHQVLETLSWNKTNNVNSNISKIRSMSKWATTFTSWRWRKALISINANKWVRCMYKLGEARFHWLFVKFRTSICSRRRKGWNKSNEHAHTKQTKRKASVRMTTHKQTERKHDFNRLPDVENEVGDGDVAPPPDIHCFCAKQKRNASRTC